MLINKNTAIHTNKVRLVPYCRHHVLKYHAWMEDPDIQAATASEQLTLEAEYAMQQTWRSDSDKLTFITCLPHNQLHLSRAEEINHAIGDVNLFIVSNEEESGNLSLVGEVELMIAEKQNQGSGRGRAALLTFLKYILLHQREILTEYFNDPRGMVQTERFDYLRVKINEENTRSLGLFESIGFKKIESKPNYFGEYELRRQFRDVEIVERMMNERNIKDYVELIYPDEEPAEERRDEVAQSVEEPTIMDVRQVQGIIA